MNRVGLFAKTFPGTVPADVLGAVKAAGFDCAQFNLACAGLDPVPAEVPRSVRTAIAAASRETGVTLAALSGTVNMIHPDPAIRSDGRRRLAAVIAAASGCGIPLVTLCTGTRDPHDPWRAHPDNAGPEAWRDLLAGMGAAVEAAERHDVLLGVEPEAGNVVSDARAARRLVGDLASPRVRVVIDPANLVDGVPPEQGTATVAAAIDLLAERIGLAHAKDRDAAGLPVAPGRGIVDFRAFFRRLAEAGYGGPIVAHGFPAAEAPAVRAFLDAAMRQAGAAA